MRIAKTSSEMSLTSIAGTINYLFDLITLIISVHLIQNLTDYTFYTHTRTHACKRRYKALALPSQYMPVARLT